MSEQDSLADLGWFEEDAPDEDTEEDAPPLLSLAGDEPDGDVSPVVRLVDRLIRTAVEVPGFSALHLQPQTNGDFRIRMRVDGTLRPGPIETLAARLTRPVVARMKILADMDISERRLPQTGRFRLIEEPRIGMSLVTTPTPFGEQLTLRYFPAAEEVPELDAVGFEPEDLRVLREALAAPAGVVLLSGPSTAGLDDVIHACVRELATPERAVMSIGEPRGDELDGVTYVGPSPMIGLTAARALRNALRADVDAVAVHEVRDLESLTLCFDLAASGKLVILSVNSASAAEGVARMLEMGVEPWLVADMLLCSVGVRRLRRLCACKQEGELPELKDVAPAGVSIEGWARVFGPAGCQACGKTGYTGRLSIFQLLRIEGPARKAILRYEGAGPLRAGAKTLREAALRRVAAGETSLTEAIRSTRGYSGPC